MAFRHRPIQSSTSDFIRSRLVHPIYEDFQPTTDHKEENGAQILTLLLPGFVKNDIKISFNPEAHLLNIEGRRIVEGNRWCRFRKVFPIPNWSLTNQIHANFQQEKLYITIPKDQNAVKQELDEQQTNPNVPTQESLTNQEGANMSLPQQTQADKKPEEVIPKPDQIHPTVPKNREEKTSTLGQAQQGHESQNSMTMGPNHQPPSPNDTKIPPPKPEEILAHDESTDRAQANVDKEGRVENHKKAARERGEDRLLLMNVGIAVIVLMAFGAYLSYKYGSSTKEEVF